MAEPYRKGEYVRYACNGVCLVDDIRLDVPAGKGTPKEFYILKPVSNPASTIFVPTGSPALVEKMARLPNREELDQLILSVKDHPLPWIEDRKARLASFQTIVKACDLRELSPAESGPSWPPARSWAPRMRPSFSGQRVSLQTKSLLFSR